ncbi:MAG: MATE family efflux transporter [Phycisphaerales bacterium]|nr:MATE family efflux transporter [Phycisphaerales bacterium]
MSELTPPETTGTEPSASTTILTPADPELSEPSPIVELLRIAVPSIVTMTSYTLMQFVDTYMVKEIGDDPVFVAAQGNGGIVAWIAIAFGLGMNTVINSFVSQNLGAGTPKKGSAYAWAGLWISVLYWLVLLVPYALFIDHTNLAGSGKELWELESGYARILLLGGIGTLGARSIHHYFYGLHRPKVVMISAISGNIVNVAVNYLLIFGNLGFPQLGLNGAAIGTVCGGLFELGIPFVLFLSRKYNELYSTRSAWRPAFKQFVDIARVGWPGGLMFFNELICWGMLMNYLVPKAGKARAIAEGLDPALVEQAGVYANTAGWIALRYMHIGFMPVVGISIAAQALVGRAMGRKRPDIAAQRTWLSLKIGLGYMALCAFVFVLWRGPLINVFINSETAPGERAALIAIGAKIIVAAAVFQLFDAVGIVMSGALRGAGDTVWPGVLTIVLSWSCIVGFGLLVIELKPEWGSVGPWIGASAYIILLGLSLLGRFLFGNWRERSLVDETPMEPDPLGKTYPEPSTGAGL